MQSELEEPAVETRLLIYENLSEIQRITQEAQNRVSILNQILLHGLTNSQLKEITKSSAGIDDYIFKEQLKVNLELRKQFEAGKKNIRDEYELPQNLQALKYSLMAWFNYPKQGRAGDKFQNLVYTSAWVVDEQSLENLFVRTKYKFYIEGVDVSEYKEIEGLCKYFEVHRMPNNQLSTSSFLWDRIEPIGQYKFKPRWTYFGRA